MKYIDEYRDKELVEILVDKLQNTVTSSWSIMEICGGQTHSIMKYGLQDLIPEQLTLIHGPGCPVCVTPVEQIEKAIAIAELPDTILTSFGDMLRVPGSSKDLLTASAEGADVRTVYSPLDALTIAREHPDKNVVFFAVGFETTAPAVAMAIDIAKKSSLMNFSILVSHVLVPPAMEILLSSPGTKIDGFLAAGHVCTVMGYHQYISIAEKFRIPISVTGFEPVDILHGILLTVEMLESKRHGVENAYGRSVKKEGNIPAQELLKKVFEPFDMKWRGIGVIPLSGFKLRKEYEVFDADRKFGLQHTKAEEPEICIAGEILTGIKKPLDCKAFGSQCTPEHPLGAPMVSAEGACSAYYSYRSFN
ncbi:hydrogenase formation protein HypD [Bacteroidota bacterium]